VRLCSIHQKVTGLGVASELASLSLQAHYAGQVAALQHVTLHPDSPPAAQLMAVRCPPVEFHPYSSSEIST
jgi:hypothetical protein